MTTDLNREPGHCKHHGDRDQHLGDPPPVPLGLLAHRAASSLRWMTNGSQKIIATSYGLAHKILVTAEMPNSHFPFWIWLLEILGLDFGLELGLGCWPWDCQFVQSIIVADKMPT